MIYFDTTYIFRLYTFDQGWEAVRELAGTDRIACSVIGRAEMIGAFHRKFRQGQITERDLTTLIDEFAADSSKGSVTWLPVSEAVLDRLTDVYKNMPVTSSLRSSDAIHLATAAENSFSTIYTNDRQLLSAAKFFRLRGLNVIET